MAQYSSSAGMEHYMPEIIWHDRNALLSVDIFPQVDGTETRYRICTCSMQKEIRIWELIFEPRVERKQQFQQPFPAPELPPAKASKPLDQLAINFIANLVGHQQAINSVQFNPNPELNMLASGDSQGRLIVWGVNAEVPPPPPEEDLPPNKENWVKLKVLHHELDVTGVAWSRDGTKLASIGRDNNLLVHEIPSFKRKFAVSHLRDFPNGVAWDPASKYIITMSTDRKMEIIDGNKGTKLRIIYNVDLPEVEIRGELCAAKSYKIFIDEQMMSFKRQPSFSPCGMLVVAPCGHIESGEKNIYGNYVWTREEFKTGDAPSWMMPSPKVTFLIRFCPVSFALDPDTAENYSGLPYRVIWLALADYAVIFYDSQHSDPIGYIENIHYNKQTDAAWAIDGSLITISSLEGYNSIIRIKLLEWGPKLEVAPPVVVEEEPVKVKKPKTPRVDKEKAPLDGDDSGDALISTDTVPESATPRRKKEKMDKGVLTPTRQPGAGPSPSTTPKTPAANSLKKFFTALPPGTSGKEDGEPAKRPPQKRIKLMPADEETSGEISKAPAEETEAEKTTSTKPTPKRINLVTLE